MRTDTGTGRLKALLLHARNEDGGWPYFAGRRSRLEPTCWALLALHEDASRTPLRAWQTREGFLLEPGVDQPNYAFNALAALALHGHAAGQPPIAGDIVTALMQAKGLQARESTAIRLNPRLQGWPWIDGTFSWAEPTAWCALAAKKLAADRSDARARIREAEALLRDRACRGGGWNYGNPQVYGADLRAHVPPSAVAVMALQDRRDDPIVESAVTYLQRHAPVEGSTMALALGWIALRAVGAASVGLEAALQARSEIAAAFGNLASAALMLFALDRLDAGTAPSEVMLS